MVAAPCAHPNRRYRRQPVLSRLRVRTAQIYRFELLASALRADQTRIGRSLPSLLYAESAMSAPIGVKYLSYIGLYSRVCVDNRGLNSQLSAKRARRHSQLCATALFRSVNNRTNPHQT